MPPAPMNYQMVLKLGIVGVTVVGIFVLAALGKIDATTSLHDIVIVVGGLTLALGISGGIASGAAQLVRGQTPETGPAVVVTSNPIVAAKAMYSSKPPPAANQRGFAQLRGVLLISALPLVLFATTGATCTPAQIATDVTVGLQAAICVLNTVAVDEQGGKSEAAAIENAIAACGVTAAQAAGILAAHRKAETIEGMKKAP
jgi:hypothetical protein